jgi:Na+/phosphate symporter
MNEVITMRKRMKAETKRKIAGIVAGILAAAIIFSSVGIIFIR